MKKKVIKLNEKSLETLVKKILKEDEYDKGEDEYDKGWEDDPIATLVYPNERILNDIMDDLDNMDPEEHVEYLSSIIDFCNQLKG